MVNPVVDLLRTGGATAGLASLIDLSSLMNRHVRFLAAAQDRPTQRRGCTSSRSALDGAQHHALDEVTLEERVDK